MAAKVSAVGEGTAAGSSRRGALVLVNGFSILGIEFAAQRQLAPVFGQSAQVWSTIVGVLLAALAIGYALGSRWGSRARSDRPLAAAHVLAAAWVLAVGFVGPSVAAGLGPRGGLDPSFWPLGRFGTVGACVVLYTAPLALLATTTPFVIARAATDAPGAGRVTGITVALGTLGSLLACWIVPLEWIPRWGTAATFVALACGATATAGLALLGRRSDRAASATSPRLDRPAGTLRAPAALAISLVAGFAVTTLEIAGVRLMSPWIGQSNYVWAAVFGVCLLALAVGSAVGGVAASSGDVRRRLAIALLATVPAAALPTLAVAPWMGRLVPDGLSSLVLLPVAFAGAIAGALLLLAPGQIALGAVLPLLAAARGGDVGRLLAANTLGGLLGCVSTAPWWVPTLGSRGTFLVVAALVLAASPWAIARGASRRRAMPWIAAAAASALLPAVFVIARGGPLRHQPGQLAEVETAYQTVRVVEANMAAIEPRGIPARWKPHREPRTRFLRHDEDAETYQSIWFPDADPSHLTGGRYFEAMALGAHFGAPPRDGTLDVLLIGHAGGTVWRTLRTTARPGVSLRCLAVEIDPGVVEMARTWLAHREIEDDALELVTDEDGRTIVNALPAGRRFDLVLVDAYARTNYVPFQVATREFFRRVVAHLEPGGWVGVNVLGQGATSRVAAAVATTMNDAIGPTVLVPNPYFPGNVILWSSPGATLGPRVGAGVSPLLGEALFAVERLGSRFVPGPHDVVLTDDHCPLDRLADEELGL